MDEILSADTLNLATNLANWNAYHSDVFDFEKRRFKGYFRYTSLLSTNLEEKAAQLQTNYFRKVFIWYRKRK